MHSNQSPFNLSTGNGHGTHLITSTDCHSSLHICAGNRIPNLGARCRAYKYSLADSNNLYRAGKEETARLRLPAPGNDSW